MANEGAEKTRAGLVCAKYFVGKELGKQFYLTIDVSVDTFIFLINTIEPHVLASFSTKLMAASG